MSARVAALHGTIAEACFGSGAGAAVEGDLGAFLQKHQVADEDRAALLSGPRRLGLYRHLLRQNVLGVARAILARTAAHADHAAPGVFGEAISRFLDGVGPRTHHLRDVPLELCGVLLPLLRNTPGVPAYLPELCVLEREEFLLGIAPFPVPASSTLPDLEVSRPVALSGLRATLRFAHPVHEALEAPVIAPSPASTSLLLYRGPDHIVRLLVLTPFVDRFLTRLSAGEPLGSAIGGTASDLGSLMSDALLVEVARLLSDLGERGVILGATS